MRALGYLLIIFAATAFAAPTSRGLYPVSPVPTARGESAGRQPVHVGRLAQAAPWIFQRTEIRGVIAWLHRLKLFRMASHLSSVLAKCTFEDVEFLAIVQVRHCHITASRSFAAPQKSIRSTLLGCCVFAATRPRDRYLLPVAFLKLPRARSVTLIISRQSARSCHR